MIIRKLYSFNGLVNQLKSNISTFRHLNLRDNALATVPSERLEDFFIALENNNTAFVLDIGINKLSDYFIAKLQDILNKNYTLTTFIYHSEGISSASIKSIESLLERNEELLLTKQIEPQLLPFNFNQYTPTKLTTTAFNIVQGGNLNLLYTLLENNKALLKEVNEKYLSLLHIAAKYEQIDCIKLLLRMGADINFNPLNEKGKEVGTALFQAVKSDNLTVTRLFIRCGADLASRRKGYPILHKTVSLPMGRMLLSYGAYISSLYRSDIPGWIGNDSVLHSQLENIFLPNSAIPSMALMQLLIEYGANINAVNQARETPIFCLIRRIAQNHRKPEMSEKQFLQLLNVLIQFDVNLKYRKRYDYHPMEEGMSVVDFAKSLGFKWTSIIEAVITFQDQVKVINKLYNSKDSPFSNLSLELLHKIANFNEPSKIVNKEARKTVLSTIEFLPEEELDMAANLKKFGIFSVQVSLPCAREIWGIRPHMDIDSNDHVIHGENGTYN